MKKLLPLFFILISSGLTQAQNCHYWKNSTDPFTGVVHKEIYVTFQQGCQILFLKDHDQYRIQVSFLFKGIVKDSLKKSDSLLIKLSDGSILKFAMNTFNSRNEFIWGNWNNRFFAEYTADESSLQKLSKASVTFMRVEDGLRTTTFAIKAKKGESISKAAACILQ
jgi:hypothetical protein